jgi:hypothetical protein
MTHACLVWEFAADSHILNLQRLQNKVLGAMGNLPRRTPTCDQTSSHILFCYETMQAEVIQNHGNVSVRNAGQSESQHRKYKGLRNMTVQVSKLSLYRWIVCIKHNLLYKSCTDRVGVCIDI